METSEQEIYTLGFLDFPDFSSSKKIQAKCEFYIFLITLQNCIRPQVVGLSNCFEVSWPISLQTADQQTSGERIVCSACGIATLPGGFQGPLKGLYISFRFFLLGFWTGALTDNWPKKRRTSSKKLPVAFPPKKKIAYRPPRHTVRFKTAFEPYLLLAQPCE